MQQKDTWNCWLVLLFYFSFAWVKVAALTWKDQAVSTTQLFQRMQIIDGFIAGCDFPNLHYSLLHMDYGLGEDNPKSEQKETEWN